MGNIAGQRVRFVGKGRKPREVWVSAEVAARLGEVAAGRGPREFLWGAGALNGEPPTVNTVRGWMRQAFAAAGISGFYPHALRHSFATRLQLMGASVAEIKEMMGHENIATTERYLHGFEGRLEELFAKYR